MSWWSSMLYTSKLPAAQSDINSLAHRCDRNFKSTHFNSLAPGKSECYYYLIFQIISVIDGWGISSELALQRWMSQDLLMIKSTLVQVMAWCRQATSHYLSQWWPICRHMVSLGPNEFKLITRNSSMHTHSEMLSCECHSLANKSTSIGWGKDLVPLGNKPLPELI